MLRSWPISMIEQLLWLPEQWQTRATKELTISSPLPSKDNERGKIKRWIVYHLECFWWWSWTLHSTTKDRSPVLTTRRGWHQWCSVAPGTKDCRSSGMRIIILMNNGALRDAQAGHVIFNQPPYYTRPPPPIATGYQVEQAIWSCSFDQITTLTIHGEPLCLYTTTNHPHPPPPPSIFCCPTA